MSIVIRGMEMPENCAECPCFSEWDDCGITHEWKFADEFDKTNDRLPSCPLVPLPEGHGRIGDLDKLDYAFTALRFNEDGSLKHWDDRKNWCLHGSEIETLLANAPTIVPAEGGGEG